MLLNRCLKSPVSEDPSKSNMANGMKHCSKLDANTFTIFIDTCVNNSRLKILSKSYAKS